MSGGCQIFSPEGVLVLTRRISFWRFWTGIGQIQGRRSIIVLLVFEGLSRRIRFIGVLHPI